MLVPPDRVYLATSWRNLMQATVVAELRDAGYDVYDFRNPNGEKGFAWSDITGDGTVPVPDPNACLPEQYLWVLDTEQAKAGFNRDYMAMQAADIFVLLLPCERDAHMEIGWATAAGKETHIVLDDPCKASLMYQLVDHIHPDLMSLYKTLGVPNG